MKPLTAKEMQALDREAIQKFGIPGIVLMENAGRGVADEIAATTPCSDRVFIFAGKGNNGGDGFVVARHLHNRGYPVQVFLLADRTQLQGDAATNYQILSKMGLPIKTDLPQSVSNADLLVDALFGIGLSKPLRGVYLKAVELMNQSGKPILAVDIPSGLHADTGEILGACVKAKATATLGFPKKGLFEKKGPEMAGNIAVVDIGLPKA